MIGILKIFGEGQYPGQDGNDNEIVPYGPGPQRILMQLSVAPPPPVILPPVTDQTKFEQGTFVQYVELLS